jgi:hypothetical protein
MDYKIINFIAAEGKVEVEYDANQAPLFIDVPLNENGLFITGQELDTFIQGFIPVWHLERLEKLKNGVNNSNDILSLVQQSDKPVIEQSSTNVVTNSTNQMWTEVEFDKQVAARLVKFGVLETDPTAISTTTL